MEALCISFYISLKTDRKKNGQQKRSSLGETILTNVQWFMNVHLRIISAADFYMHS